MWKISPTVAFTTAMMVNFVDQMGSLFTSPVIVPYGKSMGADLQTIALFSTVRGLAAILSNLWLALLSDRCGQRVAIVTSVAGCALGYAIQAWTGTYDGNEAVYLFLVGRTVSGFFCGATPVLRSYVALISAYDQTLMTQRMVNLMVAGQALGIALSPIAGALASFDLILPFTVSAVCGLLGTIWTIFLFPSAQRIKELGMGPDAEADKPDDAASTLPAKPEASTSAAGELSPGEYTNHPAFDSVIILFTMSFCLLMVFGQGLGLFIPVMFAHPSFGLTVPGDDEATQGNIAKAVGLVTIPRGVCSILVSVLLFVPVTRRFGARCTMAVSTLCLAGAMLVFGFLATKVWHTIPFMFVLGVTLGFLMPSLSPLTATYAREHYPRNMAMAQALPIMGMNLSNAFAQNILAAIINSSEDEDTGLHLAWSFTAVTMVLFMLCYVAASRMVDSRSAKKQEAQIQHRASVGEDAEKTKLQELFQYKDPDVFLEEMFGEIREQWQTEKDNLWHGGAQLAYKRRVLAAVPKLPGWDIGGTEHLEEVSKLLKPYPTESALMQEAFPGLSHGQLPAFSGDPGLLGAGATSYMGIRSREGVRRRAQSDVLSSMQPLVGGAGS